MTRSRVGFHEAARGVLSHHMVIRDGKIANYQPYPPTPWNASSRDNYGTPGPYEDAVQNTPIFEENGPDNFKGIDIMRAVRSFDPCLPCGVHMYLGGGKVKKVVHTPTGHVLNTWSRPPPRDADEDAGCCSARCSTSTARASRACSRPSTPRPAPAWPTDPVVASHAARARSASRATRGPGADRARPRAAVPRSRTAATCSSRI